MGHRSGGGYDYATQDLRKLLSALTDECREVLLCTNVAAGSAIKPER